jgi:hypothetical protein
MRIALGVVAGLVLAFVCIFAIEQAGMRLYPPPAVEYPGDANAAARMMAALPTGAFILVAFAWFIGTLVGAGIANLIARRSIAGWIVVGLIMAAALFNLTMLPHPVWMWGAGILLPLAAGWIAQTLARRPGAHLAGP